MFPIDVHEAWKAHAISGFPNEACGLVIAEPGPVFVPCRNIAADPMREFEVHPVDQVAAQRRGQILAVLHSHVPTPEHPTGMPNPSRLDMQSQELNAVPFGISLATENSCSDPVYFGDQVPMRPLIGRPYVYGVWDCYSLLRDFYRSRVERPFTLPVFPRDDDWWNDGRDLYGDNFAANGFRRIDASDARPGDCFVMRIRAKAPNHAAVLIENGLMLHHLHGQLSGREPAGKWAAHADYFLRHEVDF